MTQMTGLMKRLQRAFFARPPQREIISDYREFCPGTPTGKALVSYLVAPLLPPSGRRDRVIFSNWGIAQGIPRALNELGYTVDIVEYDDVDWTPTQEYDLFIGHGGVNFEGIHRRLSSKTVCIYFSTGIYWKEWNTREAERFTGLAKRRGFLLPPDRAIGHSEEYANQEADGIICLGNSAAVQTYGQFKRVIGIDNAAYPLERLAGKGKNHDAGRHHFLFFSGSGNVHKGLDLLLEAFAGTDWHLHICQDMDPKFSRIYKHELQQCPNIHVYGSVPMRTPEFENLATKCNWVISATCAEGQPGAIIECMAYGLIPVLPVSANLDIEDFGFLLPDCEIPTIRAVVSRLTGLSREECEHRSLLASRRVKDRYSPENFIKSFKEAVRTIVQRASD